MKRYLILALLGGMVMFANAEMYVGAGGALALPQGGSKLPTIGGGAVRVGYALTEPLSLEGEAGWLNDRCSLAARALWHWTGFDFYNDLFGYERYDPFFTVGAHGWLDRGQVGPSVGIGSLYWLSDNWALRFDAEATLGLESQTEMVYSLGVGVQYAF